MFADIVGFDRIASLNGTIDAQRFPGMCEHRLKVSNSLRVLFQALIADNDIGTNLEIGAHSADFSRKLAMDEPAIKSVAFEANFDVYNHFSKEVTRAGIDYVNMAIADTEGEMSLQIPTEIGARKLPSLNSTSSLYARANPKAEYREQKVCVTSIDAWLRSNPYEGPYSMWVDVEGAQEAVISGGPDTLRQTALFYVELETKPIWQGQSQLDTIIGMLDTHGLKPCARDIERPNQFNGLFASQTLLEKPSNQSAIATWLNETESFIVDEMTSDTKRQ